MRLYALAQNRELWYRASLAWRQILEAEDVRSALVVAHNAVNQALLNTALGLPPTFFRRLTQTNGATSVIDFQPNGNHSPIRVIDRINQARAANLPSSLFRLSRLACCTYLAYCTAAKCRPMEVAA
jgi:broad specificity phosphatase PhoE